MTFLRSLATVVGGAALVLGVASTPAPATIVATSPVGTVWVEPAAGMGFLRVAVSRAAHSVDVSMYELADPVFESALVARAGAGVRVEVLLDADYGGTTRNAASFAFLRQHGVAVRWASASRIFHAKYIIVDDATAFIGSGNLVRAEYATSRDFWVSDTSVGDVGAMTSTFNADFNHVEHTPRASAGLLWSPGSTSALVNLIDGSRHSLVLENEEMSSAPIESALIDAARRGVTVALAMTASPSWTVPLERLVAGGVHVATLRSSQIYIHAKVICADCASSSPRVFVGSENFSRTSLARNRELGVVSSDPRMARTAATQVWRDFYAGVNMLPSAPVTTTTTGAHTLVITSFDASVRPGQEDSLSVHSPRAHDTCVLGVRLPSGRASASRGLGAQRAAAGGNLTWSWRIGTNTGSGVTRATISCGAGVVARTFRVN